MTSVDSNDGARKILGTLVGHGALVIAIGLLAGFGLLFDLLGAIAIWPIPGVAADIPGSTRGWQAAHVGGILNGVMILASAACIPYLSFSASTLKRLSWALIFTGWANTIFYWAGNFAPNRGLSGGDNAQGDGTLLGLIAYVPAAVATVITLAAMIVLARAGFAAARSE